MSALAQYFALNGKKVAGYDKTPGKMTQGLKAMGILVSFQDTPESISADFQNKTDTLVVYTAAVPEDLEIFKFFRGHDFYIERRAVVLGRITAIMPTLAIAGTHGKTTTSAILAHLLKRAGYAITAFVGGILENYNTNFIGEGDEVCVVEADEYDRSFLQLSPKDVGLTSIDADHLDIYDTPEILADSFRQFIDKLPADGNLVYNKELHLKGDSVAIADQADYDIQNVQIKEGTYYFDLKTPNGLVKGFQMNLPGRYNLMNAGIALALAIGFGAKPEQLKPGLQSFKGVERRFSYHLKTARCTLIEDYAHHPAEIKAVYQAVREMHPGEQVLAVFQPHLYSRTRDFAVDFARALSPFDEVFLLPVYPAREKPIPGINSAYLSELIDNRETHLIEKDQLLSAIKNSANKVVILMGAGDIGQEIQSLKSALKHEN